MKKIISSLLALFLFSFVASNAQTMQDNLWVTNATVNAVVRSGNTIYLGGAFTMVGPNVPYGSSLDISTGLPNLAFAKPNGQVLSSIPDGVGGWYIGGSFTQVGGVTRNRIARINADGSLNSWNPNANSTVTALAINGSTVYAGGSFTTIGGQIRTRIAALDATTGLATAWDPTCNNSVSCLAVNGSTVYVGGVFTSIGGQTRNRIAALDATTGFATVWNPNSNGNVSCLAINGTTVYAAGLFTSIGGQTRNRIAALDATTGLATVWDPNSNSNILSLAINGSTVYAGGNFSNIGGQPRNRIAAIDITTGLASSWNPNADIAVTTIATNGSTVYAGGGFTNIGGQARNFIAALDATTGAATSWNPSASNSVSTLSISGSTIYAGGNFNIMGAQTRNRLAALDATTGIATPWNPDVSAGNNVNALVINGSTLYVGGDFTTIGGQTRNFIAALDAITGTVSSWNPNANGIVYSLLLNGSTLYAGGDFTSPRPRIAALDISTGNASSWNPTASGIVRALAINGSIVYAGGDFTFMGGQLRNRLAAVDAATGLVTSWSPNIPSGTVNALALNGSIVYAGGSFNSINSQPVNNLAALDPISGSPIGAGWTPNPNGAVLSLAINGSTVYVAGSFTTIGGQARNSLAAVDITSALASSWDPNVPGGFVPALAINGSTVYVGGGFTSIGGNTRSNFAGMGASCPTITVTNPGTTTGALGTPFSQTFTQSGGALPVTFTTASTLPTGLTLSSAGVLSGTPTQSGTFPITVTATDASLCPGTGSTYSLVISCPVVDQTVSASPTSVCAGASSTITVGASQPGINYTLRVDPANTFVAGPTASNGPAINFNTGPIGATTTYNVLAETDKYSVYLNGGEAGFIIPQAAPLDVTDNFTIEGWIKPDGIGAAYSRMFNKSQCYALGLSSGQSLITFTRHNAGDYSLPYAFVTGQWYHIACTYVGGTVEFFVNGVSIGTVGGVLNILTNSLGAQIGSESGFVHQFRGNIDNVRLWNSVRSPAEIAANQTAFLTSTGNPSLVGSWWIIEGTGNAKDYSANAINATSLQGTWQTDSPIPPCNITLTTKPTVTVVTPDAIATPASQTLCSGAPITTIVLSGSVGGTVFNWTRDNTVAVTGIAASGSGDISGTLTNTTNAAVTVTFTITPVINGTCFGTPITATVTVNPIPDVNQPANQVVCNNGATAAVNFTGSVAGTTFNWTNNAASIGLAASGTGNIGSFTATNATNAPVTATITVTPSTGGSGFAYIPNQFANNVTVINTTSNTVVGSPIGVGTFPSGVSVTPDGSRAYITNGSGNNVSVINTATNTVIATVPVQVGPIGIVVSPNGTRAYVANQGSASVSVINTATNTVIGSPITVGSQPTGIAISPDGSRVYVTSQGTDDVSVINTATNAVIAAIPMGTNPLGLAVTPDGSRVYVVNGNSGDVYVINTATNTVLGSPIVVGSFPGHVAITPDGTRAYVANQGSNNVSVINTATNNVVATVAVGLNPWGLSITSDGSRVYVVNYSADNVSVINTATNTVIGSPISTGDAPVGLGNFITPGTLVCSGTPKTFTITVNPTPNAVATPSSQTKCSGVPITTIALTGNVSGTVYNWTRDNNVPVTGIAASGAGDISGTLTNTTTSPVTVTFTITPSYTNAGVTCTGTAITATVLVNPTNTITLSSAPGTDNQTVLINTPITNITYATTFATGATVTGLPTGVTPNFASNTVTISGTPSVQGTFNYTVTLTGGCGNVTATGTINVIVCSITRTSAAGTDNQTVCSGAAITTITYSTTGATNATVTGLPPGLTNGWAANVVTISGNAGGSGTYNYTVTPTGGSCTGAVTATGTITVNVNAWTGAVSTNWFTAGNWTCGVPLAISDVTIPSAPANQPLIGTGTAQVHNITIQSGATLTNNGTLNINGGGSIANNGTYTGTGAFTGAVYNNNGGTIRPGGSPGCMTFGAGYTNGSGTEVIEIGGTTPCTQYDQIQVTGTATLSGVLDVQLYLGYTPTCGESYTIMTATSVVGTFTTVNTPALPAGMSWSIQYNATSVVLSVTGTPTATATPSAQQICSGSAITTIVLSGSPVAGTVYNWVRDNVGSVTGIAASGTGNISGTLTNTTGIPVTVTFTITPVSGTCTGAPITATVVFFPERFYVNGAVGASGNGFTWGTAFKTLQEALAVQTNLCGLREIWVAKGTYVPTTTLNRAISFVVGNVRLYGGFAGGEVTTAGRNFVTNETILSGEIGAPGNADNTYQVVIANFLTQVSRIDGFTVRDGNANAANPQDRGGGIRTRSGNDNLTIENIVFKNNNASNFGGGLHILTQDAGIANSIRHKIINCTFDNNTANFGGGLYITSLNAGTIADITVTGCTFTNNTSTSGGGAIITSLTAATDKVTFTNCRITNNTSNGPGNGGSGGGFQGGTSGVITFINSTFAGNQAVGSIDDGGGGVMMYGGTSNFYNCSFNNNTTGSTVNPNGNAFSIEAAGTVNLYNSIVWGAAAQQVRNAGAITYNNSDVKGLGLTAPNMSVDPLFVNAGTNDLHLMQCSPAINAGNNANIPVGITTDLDGNPRIFNTTVDMGAYEYQLVNPTLNAVATPASQTSCSGAPITTIVLSGSAVPGTIYNWTRDNVGTVTGIAASGSGDISGTLTNTTAFPVTVTFTITPISGSCTGAPITATVLVNPFNTITLASVTPTSAFIVNPDYELLYKAGSTTVTSPLFPVTTFAAGTSGVGMTGPTVTFSNNTTGSSFDMAGWSWTTNMGVANENGNFGSPRNMIAFFNGASFGGGTLEKSMTQTLSENLQQQVNYTLSADFGWRNDNGVATNPPLLRLYAGPTLLTPISSVAPALVKGSFVTYSNTYNVNNIAISGPLRIEVGLGANVSGQQLNADHVTLTRSSNANQTVCVNTPITTITYNTTWATGATFSGLPAGVTGSWAANVVTINGTPTATGTFNYTINLTGGCGAVSATGTIVVNPAPTAIATPASQTICSASAITPIILSGSAVPGTIYNWTRDNVALVTGIAASGSGFISGTLTNITNGPLTVTFTITPTANGCAGTPITATVLVNPTPDVNQPANQVVCNNTSTAAVNFTGTVAGTTFNWTNNTPSIGLAASGAGDIASFSATNAGNTPITATITVTPVTGSGAKAYVAAYSGGTVTVIDANTNAVITTIPTGPGAEGVSVVPATNRVYVCNNNPSNNVSVINSVTNTVIATIPVNNCPNGLVALADGSKVYVSNFCSGNVSVIDAGTNTVVTTIGPLSNAWGMAAKPDGSRVYVTIGGGNVAVINTATNTVLTTVAVGANPRGITVTPDGSKVYVANEGSDNVSVINAATNTVTATIPVGSGPQGITVSPDGTKVYVANEASGNVSVINTATNTVVATITGIAGAYGISITPDGSKGVVGNGTSANTATIFNTATNSVITSVPVGTSPFTPGNFIMSGGAIPCTGTPKTFTITVNPIPNVVATPSSQTKCSGVPITTIVLTGNVAGTVYNWTRDNSGTVTGIAASGAGDISGTLTNTTNTPITVTFTITPSYTNAGTTCTGTPITATVLVNPTPNAVASPSSQTVCSGVAITTIVISGNVAGTVYNWTRDNTVAVTGIAASGAGNISGTLTNTTVAPVTVTFTITPTANGCAGTPITATVLVNPTPTAIATPASQTKCSGVPITTIVITGNAVAGVVYNWTRDNVGTVTGIAASGTGNISGTLTNTVNIPITVTFTITPTANGCNGTPITATVLVNPTPNAVATPSSQTSCSGTAIQTIVLSGAVSGTVFNWTRDNTVAVTGIAASGSGNISGTLTNTTNAAVTVTFTITPTANGCAGTPITATVVVNPVPNAVATPASQTICSANPITTIVLTGNVAGTVFNWTRDNVASVTGIAASGAGNISGTLTNNTNIPITVTFTITPTYTNAGATCTGPTITATVLVNPTPNATAAPANQVICSGSAITPIIPSGNVAGTVFNWTRDNVATVTGMPASGSGTITGSLTNTTFAPVTVTFTITPVANGCTGPSFNATVVVNPIPNAVATPPAQTICSGSAITTIVLSGNVVGTVFTWTRDNNVLVTGIAASGTGDISGSLTNSTFVAQTVTFTITPSYTNAGVTCVGPTTTATVIVNPIPNAVATPSSQTICSGNPITTIVLTGNVVGTVYNWTRDNGDVASGLVQGMPASGTGNISGTLTNTSNVAITVTFFITPSYTNAGVTCTGPMITATVTVEPSPTVNPVANQVLCAGSTTAPVNFTGAVAGTIFNWTNNNTGVGLGASGTGNIPSFVATNATNAPLVATVTVTPLIYTNNAITLGGGSKVGLSASPTIPVGNSPYTIEAWVKPTAINGADGVIGWGSYGATNQVNAFRFNGSTSMINYWWGNDLTVNIPNVLDGNWHHVAATFDGTTRAIYFDGILMGSDNPSGHNVTTASNLIIGQTCPSCGFGEYFTGSIDEVRIWNVGRTGAQILANKNTTVPINAPNLAAYWRLDEGTGTTPADLTVNGNNGVFINNPSWLVPSTAPITSYASASCTGTPITFTYTVNPIPNAVATPSSQTVCSGTAITTIVLTGNVAGTVYNWTRDNTVAVTGIFASGTGNISGTPVNTTNAPVTVTFTITPTYTNAGVTCTGPSITATVLVNPTPIATATPASQTICSGAAITPIVLTSTVAGTTYAWTRDNVVNVTGIAASGTTNPISGTLTNTTAVTQVVTFTITPTANGCAGPSITATVTVYPPPNVNQPANQVVCNGSATALVHFTGSVPGTIYNWTNNNTSIGLAAAGSGDIPSFIATNTGNAPQVATITVTPTANGCPGTPVTFTITVNPTPVVNAVPNQVVCNNTATAAVNFTSPTTGGTIVYNWTHTGAQIGQGPDGVGNIPSFTAINNTGAPITATFTVIATYTNGGVSCVSQPVSFTITVNPTPVANQVANQVVCHNTATAAVNFTGNAPGTVYNWTNSAPSIGLAASGTGNIASFTATNATGAPVVATIVVTPTYTNAAVTCTGPTMTFTITVNPVPTVNAVANQAVCNGAPTAAVTFTGNAAGTVYNWTNNNTSIGLAAAGTGNIASFTAINTGTAPVVATITVTPTFTNAGVTCTGTPITFTITVNPTPTVNAVANQTLCNGATTTAVTFAGAVAGTTFNWTNNNTSIGLAASGTGNIAAFTATNTTSSPVTATITVTPTANGCAGTPITFTITVNPTPVVAPVANQTLCAGASTTAVNFTSLTAGTTFAWTNSNTAIGLGASGTGNIPGFVATNAGTTAISGTITVTPSANGCTGAAITFTITVNPRANVAAVANQTLCNGAATAAITFTGTVAGTIFNWTNSNTAIGLAATGQGNIPSFTATNTTAAPITATITVTPTTAAGCTGTAITFTITVNPTPTVNAIANQALCTGGTTTAITFSGATTGTVFNWTNNNTSIGLAASGTGNINPFVVTNISGVTQVATITVTPTANGCAGTPRTFTITVFAGINAIVIVNAPLVVCLTDTIVNLVATPLGGVWSGRGISGNTFNAAAAGVGVHTLTYTFTNGTCTGTASVNVTVRDCPERHNVFANAIKVYPNPNNGQFNIRYLSDVYKAFNVRIIDADGHVVRNYAFTNLVYGSVIPFDLRALPSATYFLEVYNEFEKAAFRVVIMH